MIKKKADPNYDDFFNQHRKPLTILPQLLIKGAIKKLVREVLDSRTHLILYGLLEKHNMFNIEPKGFPYSLQVALQMRKMHHMFLGKNRAGKHVNRSIDFIVEAIKAETE